MKQRSELGKAEISRSTMNSLLREGSVKAIELLLEYIDVLERLNKGLEEANRNLFQTVDRIGERIDELEVELERVKGWRIQTPVPPPPEPERVVPKRKSMTAQRQREKASTKHKGVAYDA